MKSTVFPWCTCMRPAARPRRRKLDRWRPWCLGCKDWNHMYIDHIEMLCSINMCIYIYGIYNWFYLTNLRYELLMILYIYVCVFVCLIKTCTVYVIYDIYIYIPILLCVFLCLEYIHNIDICMYGWIALIQYRKNSWNNVISAWFTSLIIWTFHWGWCWIHWDFNGISMGFHVIFDEFW